MRAAGSASNRTLLISLDCVNAQLLERATRSGQMPRLAAIRSRGRTVFTEGLGLSAEGDWLSLLTGFEPAEHGHIAYDEIVPGTYRSRLTSGPRLTKRPIYEAIDRAGRRTVVLNPVHAGLSVLKHGVMVVNFQAHDAGHYFPLQSHPPELAVGLARRYADDPVNPNDWGNTKMANPLRLLEGKRETLRRKTAVAKELLSERPWEFAYVGLDESHEMSHLFWHLHDAGHPRHGEIAEWGLDPVKEMLADMDGAVGELLDVVPPDCLVIIASVAGIAGNYHWSHLVDRLLDGFEGNEASGPSGYSRLRKAWNFMPHSLQRPLNSFRHHVRESMLNARRSRRRAFALPLNEVAGAVRINLRGREPKGIVPAQDYNSFLQELGDYFCSLRCVKTNVSLVRKVFTRDEIKSGEFGDRMPDLFIEWNTDQPIWTVTAPGMPPIHREFDDARTGHHINKGLLIYAGPNRDRGGPEGDTTVRLSALGQAILRHQIDGEPFNSKLFEPDVAARVDPGT
jgi:predicted AlkP superfamily phosphohydrolase/phosphomutase